MTVALKLCIRIMFSIYKPLTFTRPSNNSALVPSLLVKSFAEDVSLNAKISEGTFFALNQKEKYEIVFIYSLLSYDFTGLIKIRRTLISHLKYAFDTLAPGAR